MPMSKERTLARLFVCALAWAALCGPSLAAAQDVAIDPIGDDAIQEGATYLGPSPTLSSGDPPITWSLSAGPAGMGIDPGTGAVIWDPTVYNAAPYTITVRADNATSWDETSWNLTITSVPPVINDITIALHMEGSQYDGPVPELLAGVNVAWSLEAGEPGMTINPATGVVSWPAPVLGGPHTITIRATNGAGQYDDETWTVSVVPGAVAPVIADIPDHFAMAGSPYTGPTPALLEGTTPALWNLSEGPAGMSAAFSTGIVTWAAPVAGGPYTVTIQCINPAGLDSETWALTVGSPTSVRTSWVRYE